MTDRPEPIPFSDRQIETLVQVVVLVRFLRDIADGLFPTTAVEEDRAAVIAAFYREGNG